MSRVHPTFRKPVIGLVGGIGSGKSTVARIFGELGAAVVDFDRLAHDELVVPEVVDTLRAWWGDSILPTSGKIDRQVLASIVFGDAAQLARLEGLLYPRLKERSERIIAGHQIDPGVAAVILDAPKLLEAGLADWCDVLVFIDADRAVRSERVTGIRGWSPAEWERRENLQIPLDRKRANADYVIVNHSSIEHLRSQVEQAFKSVLASYNQDSGGPVAPEASADHIQ